MTEMTTIISVFSKHLQLHVYVNIKHVISNFRYLLNTEILVVISVVRIIIVLSLPHIMEYVKGIRKK